MGKCKHTYTDSEAPTNTGSLNRPARFNLRLDCSARARTLKVFSDAKRTFYPNGLKGGFAEVWEKVFLPLCEHAMWNLHEGKAIDRQVVMTLIRPLEQRDTKRATYQRLQMSFKFTEKQEQR